MILSPLRLAVASSLVAALSSQTFVVDANNGAGTNFTSLATALNAAPDGATLIVRAGAYSLSPTTSVAGKGLTILGQPGAVAQAWVFTFSGQSANQCVVVKGMQFGDPMFAGALQFQSCQGPVHIEDCRIGSSRYFALTVTDCSQVSVARCAFSSSGFWDSTFSHSNVACTDTEFTAVTGRNALEIVGGRTQLTRCVARGGGGGYSPNPGRGIEMSGGELRLLGPGTVAAGAGPVLVPAIGGSGAVRATSTIVFSGATIPFITVDEGSTSSTGAPLGGTVTATLEGSANLFGGLLFGLPRPPSTFPDIGEELWVDPLGFAISGSLGTPLTYWLAVPNDQALRGLLFGWQGLTLSASGFVLSNPAWFCVQ